MLNGCIYIKLFQAFTHWWQKEHLKQPGGLFFRLEAQCGGSGVRGTSVQMRDGEGVWTFGDSVPE